MTADINYIKLNHNWYLHKLDITAYIVLTYYGFV